MELDEWHRWWKTRGGRGLRRILMEQWDPIGVAGMPEAADEYDSYVGQVGTMLHEGATQAAIAEYLTGVRTEHMGLPGREAREDEVAAAVTDWYREEMRASA